MNYRIDKDEDVSSEILKDMSVIRIVNYVGNPDGWSMLHQSCREGNLEEVKFLADCGANVFRISYSGSCPLSVALQNKHHYVAKYLIEKCGAVPFWLCRPKAGKGEYDDLFNGEAYRSEEVFEHIRDEKYLSLRLGRGKLGGYSIRKSDLKLKFKEQPIWHAILSGNVTCVKVIVDYIMLIFECAERKTAYRLRNYPTLTFLLHFIEKVWFMKFEIYDNLKLSIRYACKYGKLDIVKALVDANVPFDLLDKDISYGHIRNNEPWPLYTAIKYGQTKVVDYLLEKGAEVRYNLYYKVEHRQKFLSIEKHLLRNSLDVLRCVLRHHIQKKIGKYERMLLCIPALVEMCIADGRLDVYEMILAVACSLLDIRKKIDCVVPGHFPPNLKSKVSYLFFMWFYTNGLHHHFNPPIGLEKFEPYSISLFDRLYFQMKQSDILLSILK